MLKILIQYFLISSIFVVTMFAKVTPSDVYKEARNIKMVIAAMVVKKVGVELIPVMDIDLSGASPYHVYSLSASLNEKIGVYMKTNDISGFKNLKYPSKKITPFEVNELLFLVQNNLNRIDSSIKFKKREESNKNPSDVMKEIVFANLWIDKLLGGKIAPNYPYMITEKIEHELDRIAKAKGIENSKIEFKKMANIKPKDVFVNAGVFYTLTSLYDTTKNGTKNPNRPYDILSAEVKVQPSDVFTLSVFVLNYLYYLEGMLGIEVDQNHQSKLKQGIKPNDVYMQYSKLNYQLLEVISKL